MVPEGAIKGIAGGFETDILFDLRMPGVRADVSSYVVHVGVMEYVFRMSPDRAGLFCLHHPIFYG